MSANIDLRTIARIFGEADGNAVGAILGSMLGATYYENRKELLFAFFCGCIACGRYAAGPGVQPSAENITTQATRLLAQYEEVVEIWQKKEEEDAKKEGE